MSGEAFAIERLREDPGLDFAAVRAAALDAGIDLQPIQYGRAKRQLGLTGRPADPPAGASLRATGSAGTGQPEGDGADDDAEDGGVDDGDAADTDVEGSDVEDGDADDDEHGDRPDDGGERAEHGDAEHGEVEPGGGADGGEPPGGAGHGAEDEGGEGRARAGQPARKGSSAFDFLVEQLRREPTLSYGEVRARAEKLGHRLAPIMYGRAKAMLGLVPVRPRGSGKAKKGDAAPPARPPAPRSLKQVESVDADRYSKQLADVKNLDELISAVKQLDAERRRLRALLEQIADTIDDALGYGDD